MTGPYRRPPSSVRRAVVGARTAGVPEDVHRQLKVRAAVAGVSLSEFVRTELERSLAAPTTDELLALLADLEPVAAVEPPANTIRRLRDAAG